MKKIFLIVIAAAVVVYLGYKVLVFYDNEFQSGRMWETSAVRPYEQPMLMMEAGLVPFSAGEENFKAVKAEALKSPLQRNDTETIKQGKTVYSTYCAQCHGKRHDGNGTVGQSFYPLPTDLRSEKVQSKSDGVLFKEISYGKPGGRQPALATTISVMDRWRVIAYVKSLGLRQ